MISRQKTEYKAFGQLAWMPIPVFFVAIIVLSVMHWKVDWDLPTLRMILTFTTRTLVCLVVAYLFGRNFLVNGELGFLLLGCGVMILASSGFIASSFMKMKANYGVGVSNIGIWLAALCHMLGVILSIRFKLVIRPTGLWLGVGYTLTLGVVMLITMETLTGWFPVFFVHGQGGTLVRYIVLSSALAMFVLAAVLLWQVNRPSLSAFAYWYILALLLIAVYVLGIMLLSPGAGLLNWACRASQYLSCIYMLIAAIVSKRESGTYESMLNKVINEPRYRYVVVITVVIAAIAMRLVFLRELDVQNPFLTFYPAVMIAALYGGLWPGLLAAILSALGAGFFFFEPSFQFHMRESTDWLSIVVFILSCSMITFITETMHRARAGLVSHQKQLEELVKVRTKELEREITERKLVEEMLRESEGKARQQAEELEKLMDIVPVGIWVSQDPHCRSIVGNKAAGQMNETIGGRDVSLDKVNGEILNNQRRWFKDGRELKPGELPMQVAAARGEDVLNYEMDALLPSGKWMTMLCNVRPLFDERGQVRGCLGVYLDITERKRAEEAVLASERELLKVTLNSLGEGVVAIDQEARIIFINEIAANLIGCCQNKAKGQPLDKVFYVFDGSSSEPIDVRIPQKNGGHPIMLAGDLCEIPIALNCSPIKAADGQIIGTVAVFEDISEKLKIQQELSKADKLESLGILAGGIAHDFNNILGAIISNIQLAALKLEKHQDIRKYLANTVEITRKASELTKQLLTFAKGGSPVRKDSSLIDLIKDTSEFALRGAKVKVEFAIPDNLWPASIDEGQFSQVIHNFVINAQQAMLRGGIIRISAENIFLETESFLKPGNYVKISVQDQGVGIPKENLGKIFDPFFTTKKDGNGLGLTTSYSIIRHHEGYIEVDSQEGVGTTFRIYLPASKGMIAPVETCKEAAASGEGFKILLMDDEMTILNAVGEILRQYGYQVVLVTDGTMAIQAYQDAKHLGEPFDAVVMDLTVPGGMGGQEAIAILRDFDPEIKAIISSGYANDPTMADFERFGFVGMVGKPYKIDELYEVLQKVIQST